MLLIEYKLLPIINMEKMFKIIDYADMSDHWTLRENKVCSQKILGLSHFGKLDKFYLKFLQNYQGIEISADIILLDYDLSKRENDYIASHYPKISKIKWLFAQGGQGDMWFLNENNLVEFYDHEQGELVANGKANIFVNMGIDFLQFMQVAFLFRQLECVEKKNICLTNQIKSHFQKQMTLISTDIVENYPFVYFD